MMIYVRCIIDVLELTRTPSIRPRIQFKAVETSYLAAVSFLCRNLRHYGSAKLHAPTSRVLAEEQKDCWYRYTQYGMPKASEEL
jgi:hypothetical protein